MMHQRGQPAEDAGYRRGSGSDRNRNIIDGPSQSIAQRLGNGANTNARDNAPGISTAPAAPQPSSLATPVAPAVALTTQPAPIDREKTCPLLLRAFPKLGGHHRLEDFGRAGLPRDEVQVSPRPVCTS